MAPSERNTEASRENGTLPFASASVFFFSEPSSVFSALALDSSVTG